MEKEVSPIRARTRASEAAVQLVQRGIMGIIALALVTDAMRMVLTGFSWAAVFSIVFTGVGVFVSLKYSPYLGIALITIGCVGGALLGWEPIAEWSVACFNAFLLTFRGASGLVVGAVTAASNLATEGISSGHILPSMAPSPSIAAFIALMFVAAGSAWRNSRLYSRELEMRTEEAISSRATAVERSVAEERLRIARDLHDSVGHNIAMVNMRIGSAEVCLPDGAEESQKHLEAARAGIKDVLTETQHILRVLRVNDELAAGPPPNLSSIQHLIETFKEAGLVVEETLPDLAQPLQPDTGNAAYRIVQEALTNAHKHGVGRATLSVTITDEEVSIESINLSSAARDRTEGAVPGGHGLIGIQERAASVGGQATVTDDGHTFWLRATLPNHRKNPHE